MTSQGPAANVFVAFLELARLRIVFMVLVSCAIGYLIAFEGRFMLDRLLITLLGTGMLSAGSCALNCYIERNEDSMMERTCNRPIPAGIVSANAALVYGSVLILTGDIILFSLSMLAGILGLAAVFIYLAVYTPAKRVTAFNTTIGAIPGAIPPLIGWVAARSQIDPGGWMLFAMLFIWQHTHFLPIAWIYKNDYAMAGFKMLTLNETTGRKTFLITALTALILLPVSMLPVMFSFAGSGYFVSTGVVSILLLYSSALLLFDPTKRRAYNVLALSLCYLPLMFAGVIFDRCSAQF